MSIQIGIAIAVDGVTASIGEGGEARTVFVPANLSVQGPDLAAALALAVEELQDRIEELHASGGLPGGSPVGARVTAALLPPFTETKLLHLPPLAAHEAEEVVRRAAGQYFLSAGVPSVIGVEIPRGSSAAPSGEGEAPTVGVVASAAPRSLADVLYQAVTSVGWTLSAIVPAHAAWLAALRGGTEKTGASAAPRVLVALADGTAHLVRLDGDGVSTVRRLRASDAAGVLEAAGSGPGRVWVFGQGSEASTLLESLLSNGWHPAPPRHTDGGAAEVAARWADHAGMELVPPRLAMARRDRVRRTSVAMGGAAAVFVIAAAGLQVWGIARELEAVRDRRAEIRDAVAPVVAIADELWAIEERLESIEAVQRLAGSWTLALVELSVVLPDNVHLVGLQAAGDTLVIDAVGQSAGDALDALRGASTLTDIRQEGPIQYEVEDGEVARERFTLSALRVSAPGVSAPGVSSSPPTPPTTPGGGT